VEAVNRVDPQAGKRAVIDLLGAAAVHAGRDLRKRVGVAGY
jgi:hypothetical protein